MTATPPAPTVTSTLTPDPCPRVEVLVHPMPSDAVAMTVWRQWAGQQWVVRDAIAVPVAGDAFVIDYEVPLSGPVTYIVQTFDVAGNPSLMSAPSSPFQSGLGEAWLQDPLDPTSALQIRLNSERGSSLVARRASFSTLTYSTQGTVSPVVGSALPLAFGDVRQAPSGIPLDIRVTDPDDLAALRALLRQTFVLCLRSPDAAVMLDPLMYVTLGEITETWWPIGTGQDTAIVTATAQQVMPPGAGVVVQPRSYADLLGEANTYASLLTVYSSYLNLERGP